MNQNVPMFLDARARARACGDRGLERAVQADLDRLGYQESAAPVRVETQSGLETTAVRAPERAVPALGDWRSMLAEAKRLGINPHGMKRPALEAAIKQKLAD